MQSSTTRGGQRGPTKFRQTVQFLLSLIVSTESVEVPSKTGEPSVVDGVKTNYKQVGNRTTWRVTLANVPDINSCVRMVETEIGTKPHVTDGSFKVDISFETENDMNGFIEGMFYAAQMHEIRANVTFDTKLTQSQLSLFGPYVSSLESSGNVCNFDFAVCSLLRFFNKDTFCLDTQNEEAVAKLISGVASRIVNTTPVDTISEIQQLIPLIMRLNPTTHLPVGQGLPPNVRKAFIKHNNLLGVLHSLAERLLGYLTNDTFAKSVSGQGAFKLPTGERFTVANVIEQLRSIYTTSAPPSEGTRLKKFTGRDIESTLAFETNVSNAMTKMLELFDTINVTSVNEVTIVQQTEQDDETEQETDAPSPNVNEVSDTDAENVYEAVQNAIIAGVDVVVMTPVEVEQTSTM